MSLQEIGNAGVKVRRERMGDEMSANPSGCIVHWEKLIGCEPDNNQYRDCRTLGNFRVDGVWPSLPWLQIRLESSDAATHESQDSISCYVCGRTDCRCDALSARATYLIGLLDASSWLVSVFAARCCNQNRESVGCRSRPFPVCPF